MSQTVVLDLPEETLVRYKKGAAAARKPLEEFLVDRLREAAPPYGAVAVRPLDDTLEELNQLSDDELWEIAGQRLDEDEQRRYDALLEKNRTTRLSGQEQRAMERLGNLARQLTLRKAHVYMILKWRGYKVPSPDELLSGLLPPSEKIDDPSRGKARESLRRLEFRSLPSVEARLLQQINTGFDEEEWSVYRALIAKRRAGTLQPDEQQELIRLVDWLEQANARRIGALAELAQIRRIDLDELMDELGIQSPGYE